MLRSIAMTACVLLGMAACRTLPADEPFASPDTLSNAALVYWQAFALLPEWNDEQLALVAQIEKQEKTILEAAPLLRDAQSALKLAYLVRPTTHCQWELIEQGPATLLPHLSKARQLARFMILDARSAIQHDRQEDATDHLAAAFLIARNIDQGVLTQMVVGDAMEIAAMTAGEALIADLAPDMAARLANSLASLPPSAEFADSLDYERRLFGEWLRPILTGDTKDALLRLREMGHTDLSMLTVLAGTKEQRAQRMDELIAEYDKTIAASKLPRDQATARFKELEAEIKKSKNRLIRELMPALGRVYHQHLDTGIRYTNFLAAVRERAKSK